jgi:hypothetical protein
MSPATTAFLLFPPPVPSEDELGLPQPIKAVAKTSTINAERSLVSFLIKILQKNSLLFLGEGERSKTSPKGLFQVLWVVYTTQRTFSSSLGSVHYPNFFKRKNVGEFSY